MRKIIESITEPNGDLKFNTFTAEIYHMDEEFVLSIKKELHHKRKGESYGTFTYYPCDEENRRYILKYGRKSKKQIDNYNNKLSQIFEEMYSVWMLKDYNKLYDIVYEKLA